MLRSADFRGFLNKDPRKSAFRKDPRHPRSVFLNGDTVTKLPDLLNLIHRQDGSVVSLRLMDNDLVLPDHNYTW